MPERLSRLVQGWQIVSRESFPGSRELFPSSRESFPGNFVFPDFDFPDLSMLLLFWVPALGCRVKMLLADQLFGSCVLLWSMLD